MSDVVDRLLHIVKWPVAVVALWLLPGSGWAVYELTRAFLTNYEKFGPFLGGFAGYWLAWKFVLSRPAWGSLVSSFEHELTHALFAWATLHRVVDLKATWRQGGHMRFVGRGNWLIAIAPYFFPTAAVACAVALLWVPRDWLRWTNLLLGASVAYHMTSTWIETHRRQPDLHQTGFTFAWLFLPTANLVSYGLIMAFAAGGERRAWAFSRDVYERSLAVAEAIL